MNTRKIPNTIPDPIARFQRWYSEAKRKGAPQPEAMALGTVASKGLPSVRFVLLKQVNQDGFVFFSDSRSRKGREMEATQRVAATFYWQLLGKQVRIEGKVETVSTAEADAYWATRPRPSQLSASASYQSAALASREILTARRAALARKYRGKPVPRPKTWTGFRIVPDAIEFWTHKDNRLHHREVFTRTKRSWKSKLLSP